ncbi:hypothetical protein MmiEs2_09290 [Methanimicrococcus stummii]|uniref:Uncharacterized protein n=1 Tax=Methanimicrococcus stummii TaxID=3028294 RepID=A0AA96VI74_9EURY|nr:hypothetical protein [Methanimicrococcus sp. Es2]WNY28726.1 hypothetical protein MmiEs2_09290 [Methanimicrococcus sp. Es2]
MIAEKLLRSCYSRRASVFFVLLLLVSLFVPLVSASGDEVTSSYLPAEYVRSVIDNTPATNPALIEQASLNSKTVAAFGIIPALPQGEESYLWGLVLQDILKDIHNGDLLASYHWENGGFIIGYGYRNDHIYVSVNADSQFADEEIESVIKIIQDAGKKADINDLPIIIEESVHAQAFKPSGASSAETKTIPGVGLGVCVFLLIAVVLSVRKFKK